MKGNVTLSFLGVLLCSMLVVASGCLMPRPTILPGEATEFNGQKLTMIQAQRNNALAGTRHLNQDTYKLTVNGLVNTPLSLNYDQLLSYPSESRLVTLHCVENWQFLAKWTGPKLMAILENAGIKPDAKNAIFHTDDYDPGYTALPLDYLMQKQVIIALKLNDITLPDSRGFPFQVVAEGKQGYKWAKWVTRIELTDKDFIGYWEEAGYSNQADLGGNTFGR
jgi:DMSO/TMAO reductase YedYZ molybdopterin-dependent catalytic subunit